MSTFVVCGTCSCPAKSIEVLCPHCGARLRGPDGNVARTAAAMLLGLAASVAACGDDVSDGAPVYGVPATGGMVNIGGGGASAGGASEGGAAGAVMGGGGSGEGGFAADYGVPGTGGVGGIGGAQ